MTSTTGDEAGAEWEDFLRNMGATEPEMPARVKGELPEPGGEAALEPEEAAPSNTDQKGCKNGFSVGDTVIISSRFKSLNGSEGLILGLLTNHAKVQMEDVSTKKIPYEKLQLKAKASRPSPTDVE